MEVYKRPGSPSWYVDLINPVNGLRKRKSLKFSGTKVEAQKRAQRLQAGLEKEAEDAINGGGPLTVAQALDRYVESLEVAGKVAAKNQRLRIDRMLGRSKTSEGLYTVDPDKLIHTLTPADMERLVQARRKEGKAAQTIRHEISVIRSAARYVGDLGFRTPTRMTKGEVANPWRVPTVPKKTRYLTPDEYKLVYDHFDLDRGINDYVLRPHQRTRRQDCRDLLVALAFTGGRWAEVAALTWEQVDLASGQIRLWGNKTGRERAVPLADPLREILDRRKGPEKRPRGLVFPTPDGRQRTAPSDAIGEAMNIVGLNRPDQVTKYGRATVHSLRHTFASWLVQGGATLNEVQDALGHSSIMSTVRYAHLGRAETLKKLGGVLNSVSVSGEDKPASEDEKNNLTTQ